MGTRRPLVSVLCVSCLLFIGSGPLQDLGTLRTGFDLGHLLLFLAWMVLLRCVSLGFSHRKPTWGLPGDGHVGSLCTAGWPHVGLDDVRPVGGELIAQARF